MAGPWLPFQGKNTTAATDITTVEIVPLDVIRLDKRHAVIVTRALPLDDEGQPHCDSYGCLFAIGAHFFPQTTGGWVLSKRMEAAAEAYSQGDPETQVVQWQGHGLLALASLPLSAQGADSDSVLLLRPEPDKVTFSGNLPIAEENQSWAGTECIDLLDASHAPPQRKQYDAGSYVAKDMGQCRIDGNAILTHCERAIRKADAKDHLLPLEQLAEDVRLARAMHASRWFPAPCLSLGSEMAPA